MKSNKSPSIIRRSYLCNQENKKIDTNITWVNASSFDILQKQILTKYKQFKDCGVESLIIRGHDGIEDPCNIIDDFDLAQISNNHAIYVIYAPPNGNNDNVDNNNNNNDSQPLSPIFDTKNKSKSCKQYRSNTHYEQEEEEETSDDQMDKSLQYADNKLKQKGQQRTRM